MKIGFIGLGIMGKPMSKNLLKAGYDLVVYNRSKASVEELVSCGASAAATPAETAQQSDIIITMLPNSPQVKEVVFGQNGVLEGISAGKVLIDMAAVSGCGQKTQVAPDMLVKTQVVQSGQSQNQAQYAGEVKGRYESSLSFQASGRILSRNVQLGSRVHAGDVLMVIDPKDVIQAVNRSSAAVDSASAQLSLAESNLNRYQQLYAQNAVSAAVLDQYTTAYNQAAAAYNQAQAAYVQEQNALSYTNLTADADGIISSLSGEVGQVVAAGQTVAGLVHSDELEVEIHVCCLVQNQ